MVLNNQYTNLTLMDQIRKSFNISDILDNSISPPAQHFPIIKQSQNTCKLSRVIQTSPTDKYQSSSKLSFNQSLLSANCVRWSSLSAFFPKHHLFSNIPHLPSRLIESRLLASMSEPHTLPFNSVPGLARETAVSTAFTGIQPSLLIERMSSHYGGTHSALLSTMIGPARRKGGQIRFTSDQTRRLEATFMKNKYLTPQERHTVSTSLNLSERQVKTWFQNRRAKWRRKKQDSKGNYSNDKKSTSSTERHDRHGYTDTKRHDRHGYTDTERHDRHGYTDTERHDRHGYTNTERHYRHGYTDTERHDCHGYTDTERHDRHGYTDTKRHDRHGYTDTERHDRHGYTDTERHDRHGYIDEEIIDNVLNH